MFGVFYLQSEYSLLSNLVPLKKLVSLAKEGNYDFIALSDNNNLYGMYDFFKLAKQNNLKPVIGMKIKVFYEMKPTGFLVYVKNDVGYQNLLKISTIINIENRDLDYEELLDFQEGLIFITSGVDSLIDLAIYQGDLDLANRYISRFSKDLKDFYIGLTLARFDYEIKVAPALVSLALEREVLILPLQKTSYIDPSDKGHYDLLKTMDDSFYESVDEDLSFLNAEKLRYRFSDYSFIFSNVSKVVDEITFDFNLPSFDLPSVDTKGLSSAEFLKEESFKGLRKKVDSTNPQLKEVYEERLLYELKVINDLKYANYFLIVSDFVRYAKNNDILVGPGRGSSASSLVAYVLDITEVDPIKYNLLFERFLNPARISMPDIDLDFPDDKRDLVINYVKEKYGRDHIASIITFDTFQFNSSIRDLARAKNLTVAETNVLLENLKRGTHDQGDVVIQEIVSAANAIINLPRHTGTHPAGIILSTLKLKDLIPLQQGPNDFAQTQWNMNHLEDAGLLKIDFLGIKNLTIIDEIVKLIKEKDNSFSLDKISYEDPETFRLLQDGNTNGVFQLEQGGMQSTLRQISPTKFEDLVATLALYRPGPMANIPIYAKRLKGEKYESMTPILDEILKSTYGIIVYQEQILQIANKFAGYSYSQADLLRRSISKKDLKTLQEEEKHFVESAVKMGRDEKLSKEIYDYIVKFADYGFNRAHSVSYAIVSYQMAYLKANYFGEFATILLSNNVGNEQLTQKYLEELKNKGYEILPPHINKATNVYQLDNKKVMLPINLIKGIGRETTRKFMESRSELTFDDFFSFKNSALKVFGETTFKNLIYASALDIFDLNKKTMDTNATEESSMFASYLTDVIVEVSEKDFSNEELVELEKKAYGFNIFYNEFYELKSLREKHQLEPLSSLFQGKSLKVIAKVLNVKEITTKANQKMAFLTITDDTSTIDVTVFPGLYEYFSKMQGNYIYLLLIEPRKYNNRDSFVAQRIEKIPL